MHAPAGGVSPQTESKRMTKSRLLVIGPEHLREQVARTVPGSEVIGAAFPLEGVWRSGHDEISGVFVSLDLGAKALPAVRSLRKVAPRARIVVGCNPTDEPIARRALELGADEYVLEPIQREDVERAFRLVGPREHYAPSAAPTPPPDDIRGLRAAVEQLGEGPAATLNCLAEMLRDGLNAAGVGLQFEGLAVTAGDASEPVIEEMIERDGEHIGRITVGPCQSGAYSAATAQRVQAYAELIAALMAAAREREHWQKLAWTDDLSGLHNRRYFDKRFKELIDDASQRRGQVTLFAFDIDDFKRYNDRFGHDAGDHLIREIAELLKSCTRERDVVARYGGDEFAVIFWDSEKPRVPGSKHPSDAVVLTERFRQAIEGHAFRFLGKDSPGPVTISGGLATFPWDGTSCQQLLRAADKALMLAKRTGKNTIGIAGAVTGKPRQGSAIDTRQPES